MRLVVYNMYTDYIYIGFKGQLVEIPHIKRVLRMWRLKQTWKLRNPSQTEIGPNYKIPKEHNFASDMALFELNFCSDIKIQY